MGATWPANFLLLPAHLGTPGMTNFKIMDYFVLHRNFKRIKEFSTQVSVTRRVRIVKEVNAIEEKPRTVGNMAWEQTPSIRGPCCGDSDKFKGWKPKPNGKGGGRTPKGDGKVNTSKVQCYSYKNLISSLCYIVSKILIEISLNILSINLIFYKS